MPHRVREPPTMVGVCQIGAPFRLIFDTITSWFPRGPVVPATKYPSSSEVLATAFPKSSDDVPKHFCHSNKEVGGGGEGGFPVAISSGSVDVTVSFLQLKSPKIKMRPEVMINFFIVFVFGGDYNIKNEIFGGDKLILNYY